MNILKWIKVESILKLFLFLNSEQDIYLRISKTNIKTSRRMSTPTESIHQSEQQNPSIINLEESQTAEEQPQSYAGNLFQQTTDVEQMRNQLIEMLPEQAHHLRQMTAFEIKEIFDELKKEIKHQPPQDVQEQAQPREN